MRIKQDRRSGAGNMPISEDVARVGAHYDERLGETMRVTVVVADQATCARTH
ncbi:hypothetical protein ABH944_003019 [Caballeronia udeis]|uniref:Uncharacterized protein n=1 Tax=Caballeronia udeis TaxID=1232866 RepID=A0ABW8MGW4_9BURK